MSFTLKLVIVFAIAAGIGSAIGAIADIFINRNWPVTARNELRWRNRVDKISLVVYNINTIKGGNYE